MGKRAAIITAFDPFIFRGGIETYTRQLSALLNTKGIDVTIYHTGLLNSEKAPDAPDFRNLFLKNIFQLGRKLKNEDKKYDFVIANSFYGMGYFPPSIRTFTIYHSVYGGFTERYKDVYSNDPYSYFKWLCEELGEYVSGYGGIRIAVSDSVKKELESVYGFDDVKIILHGIDTSVFKQAGEDRKHLRQELGIPRDAFVGIFVGGWEAEKRNDIMSCIISLHPDIYWLLILSRRGQECNVRERPNVIVKEEVQHTDMPLMYSLADFMLFPSAYEGFGLAIIEAMACGLPVITTNVGVAKSIYREQPFHKLLLHDISQFDAKDLTIISEKINVLKEDQKFRSEIVREGIALVRERFSLERWKKEMATVLDL
jgi:glycosyltransferase involved in cell wall biosynthesis